MNAGWPADGPEPARSFLASLLAVVMLIAAAPVLLAAMVLIRLTSRGPAIYSQARLGLRGRRYTLYKLRTMHVDSEPNGPCWSTPGDPRVTTLGRLFRRTHVDELPQLLNVLKGDMASSAPRPEPRRSPTGSRNALPEYPLRLSVRPGLTGLSQVLQGPDADLDMVRSKLALDLYYLENRNLWLDCRILLATVPHVLKVPADLIARAFGFPMPDASSPDGPRAGLTGNRRHSRIMAIDVSILRIASIP